MATGMPGTNGVWQYGEDDSEATFSALLNKVASTADSSIGDDRTRLTTLEAKPLSGLVPISPSSVVIATGSGSANALGQVSFTGATAVSLNNVFSASYKAYRVIISINASTATADVRVKFRVGGTDSAALNSANWYSKVSNAGAFNAVVQAGIIDAKVMTIVNNSTGTNYLAWDICNPFETKYTTGSSTGYGQDATSGHTIWGAVVVQNSTSFDGFTLTISAGNATGTVQVFGYND